MTRRQIDPTGLPATPFIERLRRALEGRYRVERELGAGGMATVWLAEDLKHHRQVAIKVLHPHLAAVVGGERFLKEIRTTASLQHPHILPLHDSGDADGLLFYVMPYVAGESLRQRLTREPQLPIADAVRVSLEVASALDYAHRQGVIHRDIKPENILLHEGSVLVADFGIALAPSTGNVRLTETGTSMGTPLYMSPEQALGERALDARTDIYAAGVMMYEMLTGSPPFTGLSAQAIVAKVITEKPLPPSRHRHEVSAAIDELVLTALRKKPEDRFATAAELHSALAGGSADPGSPRPHTRRIVWTAAALGAIVLGAVMIRPGQGRRQRPARPAPDSAAKRLVGEAAAWIIRREPASCDSAVALYSQATDKDTEYAEAWGGLARSHAFCALFGAGDPGVAFVNARSAAGKALQLDSTLADAYTARGMVHLFHEQNFSAAEADFATAIRLDSSRYEPWLFRSWSYFALNNLDSSLKSILHAKELAPAEEIIGVRLATILRYAGNVPRAKAELAKVLEFHPESRLARTERFELDIAAPDCAAAKRDSALVGAIQLQYSAMLLAYGWAICGKPAAARRYVDSAAAAGTYVDRFAVAMVYAALDDSAATFRSLDQAVTGHNWALFFLHYHFAFQKYVHTPAYVALMHRANVK